MCFSIALSCGRSRGGEFIGPPSQSRLPRSLCSSSHAGAAVVALACAVMRPCLMHTVQGPMHPLHLVHLYRLAGAGPRGVVVRRQGRKAELPIVWQYGWKVAYSCTVPDSLTSIVRVQLQPTGCMLAWQAGAAFQSLSPFQPPPLPHEFASAASLQSSHMHLTDYGHYGARRLPYLQLEGETLRGLSPSLVASSPSQLSPGG